MLTTRLLIFRVRVICNLSEWYVLFSVTCVTSLTLHFFAQQAGWYLTGIHGATCLNAIKMGMTIFDESRRIGVQRFLRRTLPCAR